MGGTRLGTYALLLVFLMVLLADWAFRQQGNATPTDASRVYCLAPSHLDGLVSAAVSLDLAGPGSSAIAIHVNKQTLSLAQWRSVHERDFERTCDAFTKANMPAQAAGPTSGIQALLDTLVPVIAGAVLTMGVSVTKDAADRRWAQAAELRADWHGFKSAAESFVTKSLRSDSGLPATDEIDARRRALEATLRKVGGQHRKAPIIGEIVQELHRELGPGMVDEWDSGQAANVIRGKRITDALNTRGTQLEKVADTLERKTWLAAKL